MLSCLPAQGGVALVGGFQQTPTSTMLRRVRGEEEEEERVEQEASDTSIDSDVGSLLGRYLEIE